MNSLGTGEPGVSKCGLVNCPNQTYQWKAKRKGERMECAMSKDSAEPIFHGPAALLAFAVKLPAMFWTISEW